MDPTPPAVADPRTTCSRKLNRPNIATATGLSEAAQWHPVALHLAGLNSPASRDTIQSFLNSVARLAGARDAWDLDWASLRIQDLQILRARMQEQFAAKTANSMLSAVRGVLHACWQLEQIDSDTYLRTRDIKPVPGRRLPKGRMLSLEEQTALFTACAADPGPAGARDAAALALMLGAGLRKSETTSLPCDAVDLDKGLLRIVGKGNHERVVPLPPFVVTAVACWLEVRGRAARALFIRCRGRVLTGRPLALAAKSNALADALTRRCRQAGIEPCTPHDLRRTYISVLLAAGVDSFTVQKLAGHSSPSTTALYDRRGDARLREAVHRMPVPHPQWQGTDGDGQPAATGNACGRSGPDPGV